MERKLLFDKVAEQYNASRPTYVRELFEDIIELSGISIDSKILEIGPGTGQATEPFLKTGAQVVCVEPGANLAAFCKHKFRNYNNISFVNSSFEDFDNDMNQFDLVYAGTSFHWIDYEFGMRKAYNLLKNNGSIALFWNRPMVNDPNNPLHMAIQEIYRQVYGKSEHITEEGLVRKFDVLDQTLQKIGFNDVSRKIYHSERYMSAQEYKGLLTTYSDNLALDEERRQLLTGGIEAEIIKHANIIKINDIIDLHFGKKL